MRILSCTISFALMFSAFAITTFAQSTFTNPAAINISDSTGFPNVGTGNPYPSMINVTGMSGTVTDVNITLRGFGHTFPADIALLLVSPTGQHMVVQSDVGGGSPVNGVTYTFDDQATGGLTPPVTITSGTFFPSSSGDDDIFPQTGTTPPPSDCFNGPPCPQAQPAGTATLNGTFGGINPNGNWKLYVVDCCSGDTGSYAQGWSITITTSGTPTGAKKNDFDGDGKSDYAVVRNNSGMISSNLFKLNNDATSERGARFKNQMPPQASPENHGTSLVWYINNSSNNSATIVGHGTPTDFYTPADFDGDGKTDIAVWRGVASTGPAGGFFYILNSSTNTVQEVDFGVLNDNPTVVGDYDGDRKADPAVFRCSFPSTNGQCFFFYKGSLNNPSGAITYVPWGDNSTTDIFPSPGDFDGDGKFDFCIQRQRPGAATQGQFVLKRSSDNGTEYINWGTSDAFIIPGDYDGDRKNDFMVGNVINGNILWSLLTRTGSESYTNWGKTDIPNTTEFFAQSDYDGDGKTDIAVYRRDDINPDNCNFYVRRSTDGMLQAFEWGATTDRPVNGWDVN